MSEDPGNLIPRPDPTALTNAAVNQAKDDLRREMEAMRQILEAHIELASKKMDGIRELHNLDIGRLADSISNLREIIFERFSERDIRFREKDTARQQAVDKALATSRELTDNTAKANREAADKFQEAVVRQMDQQARSSRENRDAMNVQITALEKRLDRSEGLQVGQQNIRTDLRNNLGITIAAISVIVSVVLGILLAIKP